MLLKSTTNISIVKPRMQNLWSFWKKMSLKQTPIQVEQCNKKIKDTVLYYWQRACLNFFYEGFYVQIWVLIENSIFEGTRCKQLN